MINSKDMLLHSQKNKYAVPAFNCHNLETIQVVVDIANELRSPVIVAGTPGTFDYAGRDYVQAIVETACKKYTIPICLHLDHHTDINSIKESMNTYFLRHLLSVRHRDKINNSNTNCLM